MFSFSARSHCGSWLSCRRLWNRYWWWIHFTSIPHTLRENITYDKSNSAGDSIVPCIVRQIRFYPSIIIIWTLEFIYLFILFTTLYKPLRLDSANGYIVLGPEHSLGTSIWTIFAWNFQSFHWILNWIPIFLSKYFSVPIGWRWLRCVAWKCSWDGTIACTCSPKSKWSISEKILVIFMAWNG